MVVNANAVPLFSAAAKVQSASVLNLFVCALVTVSERGVLFAHKLRPPPATVCTEKHVSEPMPVVPSEHDSMFTAPPSDDLSMRNGSPG